MRIELRIGLFLNVLSILMAQFNFLPDFAGGFVAGLSASLGVFCLVVALLPQKTYDRLAYRKLLARRQGK